MSVPKYIRDIHSYAENVPYGEVTIKIRRVNKKTVSVTSSGLETLRYQDNEEAFTDISNILSGLVEAGYTGKATLQLEYKEGLVCLIGIHDEKETKYGNKQI